MCVNCLNKVLCFVMLWLASRRWSLVRYSCSGIVESLKTYHLKIADFSQGPC